jgi:hypothetical protein
MPQIPHLQLDLTVDDFAVDMPLPRIADPPSIDQVIQSQEAFHDTNICPPEYRASSPRISELNSGRHIENMALSPTRNPHFRKQRAMSMRANTRATYDERRQATYHEQNDRFTAVVRQQVPQEMKGDQYSRPPTQGKGSNAGVNQSFVTDFFSPEVFQVVLHNPTTAHRFLQFCQSRACGENMEFLNKVSCYCEFLKEEKLSHFSETLRLPCQLL